MSNTPTGPIGWVVKFGIKPGNAETFKSLAREAVDVAKGTEPGTRLYEWFVSADGTTGIIHEWFADQNAALAHATGQVVQKVLPKLMGIGEFRAVDVFGTPGPALAKALEAFPVTSRNAHLTGFTR